MQADGRVRRPGAAGLAAEVAAEVRWSFRAPRVWLLGVAANLVMSLLYLVVVPLTGHHRSNWVVLLGAYFGTFILADVTSTNLLGPDAARVRARLANGASLLRILLIKNAALLVIVAVPTLLLTAILTLTTQPSVQVTTTLPGVAYPMLVWVAVGNVVSVLLPVEVVPLLTRWRERHDLARTVRWLFHLALPYLLLYPVAPLEGLPRRLLAQLPRPERTLQVRALTLWLASAAVWAAGLALAAALARRRPVRIR